jgi:hypothetical protein
MTRIAVGVVAGFVLLPSAGCNRSGGSALHSVTGSAFCEGKPAAGAVITFHRAGDSNKKDLPHAVVRDDGTFTVTTLVPGDGAAPGKYQLTVIWRQKGKVRGDNAGGAYILPPRYLTPEQSGLTADVKDGPTQLEAFQLLTR